MPYHKRHVINDPKQITDWQSRQRLMVARGPDANDRTKQLLLDATTDRTYWVVEATNDKGEIYEALTTTFLNVALDFYNEQ